MTDAPRLSRTDTYEHTIAGLLTKRDDAWLNLTQADFSAAAGVALSTVKDFEGGRRVPIANRSKRGVAPR